MKKEKEKIRFQIIKVLKYYKGNRGFDFFDSSTPSIESGLITLDKNDLEVLLIRINRSKKILVTTKCLFIFKKTTCTRIEGTEIERLDSMNFLNAQPEETDSMLKTMIKKRQFRKIVGNYRIVKKDGTFEELRLPKRDVVFCLSAAIKKLQFVSDKYEGI